MEQKLASYEIKNQIGIVTIDHAPMNASDMPTRETVDELLKELDSRSQEILGVI